MCYNTISGVKSFSRFEVVNMSGKFLDDKRDYLVSEHLAGRTAADLASEFGVTHKVIKRILGGDYQAIGRLVNLPAQDVISAYLSGDSENILAIRYGVSRRAVARVLELGGVTRRNQSQSETIKWSRMGTDRRREQTAAAREACRGREASFDELCARAKSREGNIALASAKEVELADMLHSRGLDISTQLAVGPYNCDLATHPVVVEVWGGHWHFTGRHAARTPERFHYLMNTGWNILVVVITERFPLTPTVADYVTAYIEELRRNPPAVCEYWVIWGAGEFSTGGCADDDEITFVPPFTSRRNPTTGQYETIPR